jgi:hypothetical protein
MGYQVALSPSAWRDLRDIVRYISLDSPDRPVILGDRGIVVILGNGIVTRLEPPGSRAPLFERRVTAELS